MIDDNLIQTYMDRFINRSDIWGKQYLTSDGRCIYACQKPDLDMRFKYEPVSIELVRRHLNGEITCAWAATSSTGDSKWLCFDSDEADGELDKLESFLREYGWSAVREGKRPGRDGHLWLFFDGPLPATVLMRLGDLMIKFAGIRSLERFPKTTGISQVRGPLGIHRKPDADGCRGWFEGPAQDIEAQLKWLAKQPLNKASDAIHEVEKHTPVKPINGKTPLKTLKSHKKFKGKINILDHVIARTSGSGLLAQCPLCAAEGHDSHCDNLHITPDGKRFCCVYGGPAQVHQTGDIARYLLRSRQGIKAS